MRSAVLPRHCQMVVRNCITLTYTAGFSDPNELGTSYGPLNTEKREFEAVQGVLPLVPRNVPI